MVALHQQEGLEDIRRMAALKRWRRIAGLAEAAAEQQCAGQGGDHQIGEIAVREYLDHGADIIDLARAIAGFAEPRADCRRLQALDFILAISA